MYSLSRIGLILLAPVVETGFNLLICLTLPLGREGSTASSVGHVVEVSNDVKAKGTSVALGVGNTGAKLEIANLEILVVILAGGQPDLGGGVAEPKDDGREAGNRVDSVSDAERGALLARCEVCKDIVADTWSAVSVDIDFVAVLAEVSAAKNGDSTSKGVASENNTVVGVGLQTLADTTVSSVLDFTPGSSEAGMKLAAGHQIAVLLLENNIGDEVADIIATTDRNNNLAADIIDSNVSSNAGDGTPEDFVRYIAVWDIIDYEVLTGQSQWPLRRCVERYHIDQSKRWSPPVQRKGCSTRQKHARRRT